MEKVATEIAHDLGFEETSHLLDETSFPKTD